MSDATHAVELNELELAELVAGLDALQRADKHASEVCFPLRNKLRALLFPELFEVAEEAPVVEFSATQESSGDEPKTDAAS